MFHQEGNKWKEGKYEEQLYYKITQLVFFSRDCCSFCVVLSQRVLLRAEGCWILKKKSTRVKLLSVSFQHKGAAAVSELLNPVSKAEPSHSAEETHFGCFNSWSHFLAHDWRLRMIVGQKLCIPARLPFYHIGSAQACQSHAPFFFFTIPLEQITRVSDFKLLTLIPTEANLMASSAKFRDMVLRFPNWTLSSPQRGERATVVKPNTQWKGVRQWNRYRKRKTKV